MPHINNNLDLFIQYLNNNKRIIFYDNENWSIEETNPSIYSLLTCQNHKKEEKRLLDIIQYFCDLLDKLERNLLHSKELGKYMDASQAIISYVHRCNKSYRFASIRNSLMHLTRRDIALYYRHLTSKEIISPTLLHKTLAELCLLAEKWKQIQPFASIKTTALSEKDLIRLQNTSHYTLFVTLLRENNTLRDNFFNWILRDNNEAEPFIEFPATSDRLHHCFIDKRVGYYNPNELQIQSKEEKSGFQKYIQLPFYIQGKISRINILDESRTIDFSSEKVSIKAVFDAFANKRFQHGKYEFLQNGILEWCSDDFAGNIFQCVYSPIKKESKEMSPFSEAWWKNLPVFQILSKENIKLRYNIPTLPDDKWIKCLRTSTTSLEYQVLGGHGFIEIAIPEEKNENYHIYPFGIYPKEFPRYFIDRGKAIIATLPAKMEYPDSNIFRSDYFQAFSAKMISADEGFKIMHSIQKDITNIFKNNLSIQVTSENCAFWAGNQFIQHSKEPSKHPFKLTFGEMKPSNYELQILTKIPRFIERPLLSGLRFFAAHHSLEIKTDEKTFNKQIHFGDSINQHTVYCPIKLVRDITEDKREGVVQYGLR
jgi:hypothetical protein